MLFVHSKIPFDDDTKESNCFFESISFIIAMVGMWKKVNKLEKNSTCLFVSKETTILLLRYFFKNVIKNCVFFSCGITMNPCFMTVC